MDKVEFLNNCIIYFLFGISSFILAWKKGYKSASWLALIPYLNLAMIPYFIGIPNKKIKRLALDLKEEAQEPLYKLEIENKKLEAQIEALEKVLKKQ